MQHVGKTFVASAFLAEYDTVTLNECRMDVFNARLIQDALGRLANSKRSKDKACVL